MWVIPAIDIMNGQCVRLTQGDYEEKTVYSGTPLEVAKRFEEEGVEWIHLVDLDGAKGEGIVNEDVLEGIKEETNLKVDFGGGIKRDQDIQLAFEKGADQVTVGSVAVKESERFKEWLNFYGGDRIILGADVRGEKLATGGWKDQTDRELFDFLSFQTEAGVKWCICTDISRDGMMEGPNVPLYEKIMERFPDLHLIASGGVGTMQHVRSLYNAGLYGVIVGKAIHEEKIAMEELHEFIK